MQCTILLQNPTPDGDGGGQETDYHWAIPRISNSEKHFLAQLISSPSKEVNSFSSLQFFKNSNINFLLKTDKNVKKFGKG